MKILKRAFTILTAAVVSAAVFGCATPDYVPLPQKDLTSLSPLLIYPDAMRLAVSTSPTRWGTDYEELDVTEELPSGVSYDAYIIRYGKALQSQGWDISVQPSPDKTTYKFPDVNYDYHSNDLELIEIQPFTYKSPPPSYCKQIIATEYTPQKNKRFVCLGAHHGLIVHVALLLRQSKDNVQQILPKV